ncbi:MAG: biotin--[Clostridia bacterium]|nr:biotin--[acetyl-CoA-carboxylase] ligase [Clostridia bacterium]
MKKLQKNVNLFAFKKIDSTNIYAKTLASEGYKDGTVVVAREQTAGKGRLGRTFFSKRGGLYFSVILRPYKSLNDTVFITTAAAVAAARAIEKVSGKKCEIKWVNDIYINNKKVCGILTEGAITPDGSLDYAILGVGINLFAPKGGFPSNLPLAGSVFDKK